MSEISNRLLSVSKIAVNYHKELLEDAVTSGGGSGQVFWTFCSLLYCLDREFYKKYSRELVGGTYVRPGRFFAHKEWGGIGAFDMALSGFYKRYISTFILCTTKFMRPTEELYKVNNCLSDEETEFVHYCCKRLLKDGWLGFANYLKNMSETKNIREIKAKINKLYEPCTVDDLKDYWLSDNDNFIEEQYCGNK